METAQRFAAFGADLLKLPFPGSASAREQVTAAVDVPWAMLSGGGSFDDFADQIAVANVAGCSGFMVGRALWGEAVRAPAEDRTELLQTLVRPRFERLVALNKEADRV